MATTTSAVGSSTISQQIDALVQQYTASQTTKLVDPLTANKKPLLSHQLMI